MDCLRDRRSPVLKAVRAAVPELGGLVYYFRLAMYSKCQRRELKVRLGARTHNSTKEVRCEIFSISGTALWPKSSVFSFG